MTAAFQSASSHEYHEWLTLDQALRAVEIEREEICKWLKANVKKYAITSISQGMVYHTKELLDDLETAMKGE